MRIELRRPLVTPNVAKGNCTGGKLKGDLKLISLIVNLDMLRASQTRRRGYRVGA